MINYSGNYLNDTIMTREMILVKFEEVWGLAEKMEKEAIELLGEAHPLVEELGLACVHLMNGSSSIKDKLYVDLPGCNKLKPNTLKQALDVLASVWWTGEKTGQKLRDAYNSAVKMAAQKHRVRRGTVRDIPIRRLGLAGQTEEFLGLVEAWLRGDPSGLVQVLKRHTDERLHELINEFFQAEKFR